MIDVYSSTHLRLIQLRIFARAFSPPLSLSLSAYFIFSLLFSPRFACFSNRSLPLLPRVAPKSRRVNNVERIFRPFASFFVHARDAIHRVRATNKLPRSSLAITRFSSFLSRYRRRAKQKQLVQISLALTRPDRDARSEIRS